MALRLDTKKQQENMQRSDDTVSGLCIDAVVELTKATKKHPAFPDEFTDFTQFAIRSNLERTRYKNDNCKGENATADSVFCEEWHEFQEAVLDRDAEKARKELVQCVAMLLRIYVHLDHYCA